MSVIRRPLAIVLGCGLLAWSSAASAAVAQEQDPASVVSTYLHALDSGDAAGAAAVFTDNAIHIHPLAAGSCSRQSPCIGRRAIFDDLRNRVLDHQCITLLDVAVSGSIVRGGAELRNDSLRAVGVERILVSSTWLVSQGKALALFVVPDLTDPQTAASAAITAGTQPPGPPVSDPSTPCS
jgi:hypothetical protein